eukprot:snap_masked-scaffold_9-processed-gene-6.45-mRNA-1 protein AED:1.00 eAED:1.00 QI:0/-1/0/0/-1/1/1/0/62
MKTIVHVKVLKKQTFYEELSSRIEIPESRYLPQNSRNQQGASQFSVFVQFSAIIIFVVMVNY